ncbi:MAG TPA: sugar transferase [Candidatus Binataceae bacterium]|nr:sugar transferase [Candidatus Binataceae bacterium]
MCVAYVRSRELVAPKLIKARSASLRLGGRYLSAKKVTLFISDSAWLLISSLIAIFASSSFSNSWPNAGVVAVMLAVVYQASFYLMDLYQLDERTTKGEYLLNLSLAFGLSAVTIAAGQKVGLLSDDFPLAPQLALTVGFIVAGRALIAVRFPSERCTPIGFIGSADALGQLEKNRSGLEAVGIRMQQLGDGFAQIMNTSRESISRLRYVVVEDARLNTPGAEDFLEKCMAEGIEAICLSDFCERALGRVALGNHLLREIGFPSYGRSGTVREALRRIRDITLGSIALILSAPLWLAVAIAIKLDSRGPVFFNQERVGRNGRRFKMFKFRSMHSDIKVTNGPHWTTHERDPRITRVGAVLRLLHLDELPQLINVIRGDMSIVGPRPFHPLHSAQLESSPFFKLRLAVPPGITGWAQIRCDYSDSVSSHEEVLARDLFYVKRAGLVFDLMVICDTIRVCIWRRGSR